MTRKVSGGKSGAKKLGLKKKTLKDLEPKGGKKVKGGAINALLSNIDCVSALCNRTQLCQAGTNWCNQLSASLCRQMNCG